MPFNIDVGQRNATFVKRPFLPLRRVWSPADAFVLVPERDYDLVHTKNPVPLLTNRPYIVTFESYMPRVTGGKHARWLESWLRGRLLGDQCVALVPQSRYALRQFASQNLNHPGWPALEAKTRVIYPAVTARADAPKKPSGRLRLLFVGKKFMRRGGPALLRAHQRLRQQGLPVETTVVSALQWTPDDYVGPSSEDYVRSETERLAQEGVTHHARLPNEAVLRLMDEADFFVLPTLHDTFGFVTIEALAGGTPVIGTDTCALPEIVEDKSCGYLLPLENEPQVGKWSWPVVRTRASSGLMTPSRTTSRKLGSRITRWSTRRPPSAI